MMKTVRLALGLLITLLLGARFAGAQQIVPPTIVSFTSSLDSITVDAAEAGQTTATLSWTTVGVDGNYHLAIDAYGDRVWSPLANFSAQPLAPSGLYVTAIRQTCGFCSPTFRLSVIDSQNRIVDQRVLTIPYAAESSTAPGIASFTTGVQGIDANSLAQHSARVPLFWKVDHRSPTSNLLFEQVFDGGGSVSIELPRSQLWVASSGQGDVAPILPPSGSAVQIRLRLVDIASGTIYAEKTLTVPILGSATVPVIPTNVPQPTAISGLTVYDTPILTPDAPAQIVNFNVSPYQVDRGATVTVTWNVIGARSLLIVRLTPDNQFGDFIQNPPMSGQWTLSLPDYYTDGAQFRLIAIDDKDRQTSTVASVRINCPYTYFFGSDPGSKSCPESGVTQVDGSYQTFERGTMIWRGDTRQIYVLLNDGNKAAVYPDSYVDGETVSVPGTPPSGLYAPTQGFAKLWVSTPDVANALGWASAPELPYSLRTQQSGAYFQARTYLALPDGRIVYTFDDQWGVVGQ